MAYKLRPFRDYDEHDVLNLFAYDTTGLNAGSISITKGSLVKIATGWKNYDSGVELGGGIEFIGGAGTLQPTNVVSQRYGVTAKVVTSTTGETPVGMMLYDVKDVDENGELLKYNPRKAAEMQAVIPGQAVPVVTRGIFLVQGVLGTPTAGGVAYAGGTGQITSSTGTAGPNIANVAIGRFLGAADTNGETLVKLAL
jgi:hypothetical protein